MRKSMRRAAPAAARGAGGGAGVAGAAAEAAAGAAAGSAARTQLCRVVRCLHACVLHRGAQFLWRTLPVSLLADVGTANATAAMFVCSVRIINILRRENNHAWARCHCVAHVTRGRIASQLPHCFTAPQLGGARTATFVWVNGERVGSAAAGAVLLHTPSQFSRRFNTDEENLSAKCYLVMYCDEITCLKNIGRLLGRVHPEREVPGRVRGDGFRPRGREHRRPAGVRQFKTCL